MPVRKKSSTSSVPVSLPVRKKSSIVSVPVSKTSSSENVTNTTSENVIEEFNNDPLLNPYHVPKSQEEKRQQIAFKNRLN